MDLNKLLQTVALVPAGEMAQWEVEGERCAQITFLGGFIGHRRAGSQLPRGLADVRRIAGQLAKDPANEAALDTQLVAAINKMGTVAGYPKIEAGFWDGPDFFFLPGLLIFEGVTGADPAWLNKVHDKTRMVVAATESGYVNTDLKFEWYRLCRTFEHSPLGKRPTLPQADSHASNESVEMSEMMELDDEAYLVAPTGHSTHLTHSNSTKQVGQYST